MIDALLPTTRRRILALLLGRPDEEFYLREIVRTTEASRGAVEAELKSLLRAGIVTQRKSGNRTYYQANRECPIFPELQGLMLKTTGLADVLRTALASLPGIDLAFLYGSVAKGTADAKSDVDVLVVGTMPFDELSERLHEAEQRLGREVNATVYSPDEYAERRRSGHHFLERVLSESRIPLVGDGDDPA